MNPEIKNHNDLLDSLAIAKGAIHKNINCGSPHLQNDVPKADLLKVWPSYNRFCIDIYEVKYSRADFLSDISSKKWEKYLPFCHRFYFACLRGICDLKEIPDIAGLLTFKAGKGWVHHRAAKVRDISLDLIYLQSLIFQQQKPNGRRKRIANDLDTYWKEMDRVKKILKPKGAELGEFFAWRRINEHLKKIKNKEKK